MFSEERTVVMGVGIGQSRHSCLHFNTQGKYDVLNHVLSHNLLYNTTQHINQPDRTRNGRVGNSKGEGGRDIERRDREKIENTYHYKIISSDISRAMRSHDCTRERYGEE